MQIEINATFIVQIINFWITFWFLNKFLLKPVYLLIQRKLIARNNFLEKLATKEQQLLGLQSQKKELLDSFRLHVKQTYKIDTTQTDIALPEIYTKDDPNLIAATIKDSAAVIIKKVANAH
jgi:hypothetical protein